jgi:hypothetical protein
MTNSPEGRVGYKWKTTDISSLLLVGDYSVNISFRSGEKKMKFIHINYCFHCVELECHVLYMGFSCCRLFCSRQKAHS